MATDKKIKSKIIDDGLIAWEIGTWGKKKHGLISYYDQLFANSMKNKWDCRVYLDLFSNAGKSYIKGTNEIVKGSALLALETKPKFDKYIFCEKIKII
jgi:three-Cys-motif partner protein